MSRSSMMVASVPNQRRATRPVLRRIADDHGREWCVREVCSPAGHALIFQCTVHGVRSEIRAADAPLASLSDDAIAGALVRLDD